MTLYASGKKAIAECDICGFRYYLRELKDVYRNNIKTGLKACPECWDEPHPQEELNRLRIEDAQAVQDPRPDSKGYPESRAIIIEVPGVVVGAWLGHVTASVS